MSEDSGWEECAPSRDASALVGGRKTECRAVFLPVAAGLPRLANAALQACKSKIAARNLSKPTPIELDGYVCAAHKHNHQARAIGFWTGKFDGHWKKFRVQAIKTSAKTKNLQG